VERLKFIETIYKQQKEKLQRQQQNGVISSRNYEYRLEKFNQGMLSGSVIVIRKNQVLDYWLRIRDPIKFAQKRLLNRKGDEVLFFKGQQLFVIKQRQLTEIRLY